MDGDPLRDALGSAASRFDTDVEHAREQVEVRAARRRRRQRRYSSAGVLVGAVVVIAVVLAFAGKGTDNSSPTVTASNNTTVPVKVVYGDLPSRTGGALAYDAARGQVVLFGGYDGLHDLADTWVWNGDRWGEAQPAVSPPARRGAAMAYDPTTKQVVVFGGEVSGSHETTLALDDTWTWNGNTWRQQHPVHQPPWNSGLAMSYDPRSKSVLLLTLPSSHPNLDITADSVNAHGETPFGTWQWNGSDWRELPTPSAPLFSEGALLHTSPHLTTLPHGGGLLFYSWSVFLGPCPAPCTETPDPTHTRDSQTWTWDGTHWRQEHPTRAPGSAQLVVTPGGSAAPTVFTTGESNWQWTGSDWRVKNAVHPPTPAGEGLAVYDAAHSDVVAYAGDLIVGLGPSIPRVVSATWTWDGSWTQRTQSIAPITTTPVAPTTTTTTAPTLGPCTSADLHLKLTRELQSVMQQPAAFFSLTNLSVTPCTIDGYPTLTLFDASGRSIPADIRDDSAYQINDPGRRRVVVQSGGTVYFGFGWVNVNEADGGSEKGCLTIASVRVLAPGDHASVRATAHLTSVFCPPSGTVTAIAPRSAFTGVYPP